MRDRLTVEVRFPSVYVRSGSPSQVRICPVSARWKASGSFFASLPTWVGRRQTKYSIITPFSFH